jgi:hypothetical protein
MNSPEGRQGVSSGGEAFPLEPAKKIDTRIKINPDEWIPGTAIAYKGEPTAEEYALLRFNITPAERTALPEIIGREVEENHALYEQGPEAVEAFCANIASLMVTQGRATPLIEDFGDPLDPIEPSSARGNGNGRHAADNAVPAGGAPE